MPGPKLIVLLLLLSACGSKHHTERQIRRAQADVDAAAGSFWNALHWDEPGEAALSIESPTERMAFLEAWRAQDFRLVEANIVDTRITLPDPDGESARTALVVVSLQGYQQTTQAYRTSVISQTWYETRDGWHLDWANAGGAR